MEVWSPARGRPLVCFEVSLFDGRLGIAFLSHL